MIASDIMEGLVFNLSSKFCAKSLSLMLKMLKAIFFNDTTSARQSNIFCLFPIASLSIIPWKHLEAMGSDK